MFGNLSAAILLRVLVQIMAIKYSLSVLKLNVRLALLFPLANEPA